MYWYGEAYVERKEAKKQEEKSKAEYRRIYQKDYEAWCAKKMANKRNH